MENARILPSLRILVAGAGALGSLYGAFLRRAGHRVTLLGRAAHLAAIHQRGLEVDGVFGEATAAGFELATRAADVGRPFDLIVLAVKSYAVESTVRPLVGALAENGRLLALQNGLGHVAVLTALVGAERLLAAPVLIGATVPAPAAGG
jgi:2-dehydropantoate 2-reductase